MVSLEAVRKLPARRTISPVASRLTVERLKAECAIKGITHEALARRADISLRSLARIFAGKHKPMTVTLRRMARAVFMDDASQPDDAVIGAAMLGLHQVAAGLAMLAQDGKAGEIKIYLAHVELGFDQAAVARVLGCSKAWVSLTVRRVEDQREASPALDRGIDAAALELRLTGGRRHAC